MKMYRLICFSLITLLAGCAKPHEPQGAYIGLLKFPDITYHIFLEWQQPKPRLINTTFKNEAISLDTIYYDRDSLFFTLGDFYSEYKGRYDPTTNGFTGYWIGEDSIRYPLEFVAALPDTVAGLNPRTSTSYQYQAPLQESDDLLTDTRSGHQLNAPLLDSLILKIINGPYADVHSVLIARNNRLVVEEYFYRIDRDKVWNIQSVTKSFVSALVGIAIEKGEIGSVHQTLCEYLPAYEAHTCNAQNKSITLHQLLSMRTGITWDEQTFDYMDERNSLSVASNERDQFIHLLSLRRGQPTFAYNSLNHLLINAVLKHATQLSNKEEITGRLLEPMGVKSGYLDDITPMGAMGDIGLRSRDMVKLGLLYLNDGKWNGKQVVPSKWIKESTSTHVKLTSTLGYGYFWWTYDCTWKGKNISSFFAWGYGGQYIWVVPEAQLVVVLSGSRWGTDPEDQGKAIMEEILAATF